MLFISIFLSIQLSAKISRPIITNPPIYLRRQLDNLPPVLSLFNYLSNCLFQLSVRLSGNCPRDHTTIRLTMDSDSGEESMDSIAKIQELEAKIRSLNTTNQELSTTITRLRASRDLHRFNTKTVTRVNEDLINKNKEVEAGIEAPTVKKETVTQEFLDSDTDDQPKFLRKTTKFTSSPTPSINTGSENNRNYPDVPDFYGDKAKWDSWECHLDTKFRQDAVLFPTEHDKMDYIRDHCKSIAFDVIKARADPVHTENPYTTSREMIEELHGMFGNFYVFVECDAESQNLGFARGVNKKTKTFDEFHARFSATVAPLGYSETSKISTPSD